MAKHLQIRVAAQTWDQANVCKTWPLLCATAEPASKTEAGSRVLSDVLELVRGLRDSLQFGPWSREYVSALQPGLAEAEAIKRELEKALADWNPRLAHSLCDKLEEALTDLERTAGKTPGVPEPYIP